MDSTYIAIMTSMTSVWITLFVIFYRSVTSKLNSLEVRINGIEEKISGSQSDIVWLKNNRSRILSVTDELRERIARLEQDVKWIKNFLSGNKDDK